jgi:hypothetical protein
MVVALIGAVLLITVVATGFAIVTEGWLRITAAAFIAVGFMLISSSVTGRATRIGEALFVATPGGLLAIVALCFWTYLQPFPYSTIFNFTWIGLGYLGLPWIFVGPFIMYRAKTRLWVQIPNLGANQPVNAPGPKADKSGQPLVTVTWALVIATIMTSIISWFLTHFVGP